MIAPSDIDLDEEERDAGMADRLVIAATLIGYVVLIALSLV